ncbi:MAG: FAD/NAD(P)-binding protein [Terriglobales bacterium]|jgi:spermidine dehydrogenase
MTDARDHELGMDRAITRRDFLNGVAMGIGSLALGSSLTGCARHGASDSGAVQDGAGYSPPSENGMRGDNTGSYEAAHGLRDGTFWQTAGRATPTDATYDLIVVGAGISGLAAAHFFRKQAGANARILILEAHDDFGGHAARKEFHAGNRTLLGYGAQSIESPSLYSVESKGLLADLGVDVQKFYRFYDQSLYSSLKLGSGMFFDRETFGEDRLVAGFGKIPHREFFAKAPLSEQARRDIVRLYTENVDYLRGRTPEQKKAILEKTSYADFLTKIAKCTPDVVPVFQTRSHDLFGVGIDAVSAFALYEEGDDYGYGYPGLDAVLGHAGDRGGHKPDPYIFHFPDGNASIARLLVRDLTPEAIPGHTMEDVVVAKTDYSRLDRDSSPVRIRLNSTVVRVRHDGELHNGDPGSAREVEVTYTTNRKLFQVRGRRCVLACYNGMVPYLCPELPTKQKEALVYGVRTPLVYSHIAIRNWTSFQKLGVNQIAAPGSYHVFAAIDFPVSIGEYKFPNRPEEPMVVFMLRTPCQPGLSEREQHRLGRVELFDTPFTTFERNIRDQLGRMLGPGGFDPAADIEGITVGRWAHGYAYGYNSLFDPHFAEGEAPNEIGRKPFGRITIANSDAGATAYMDVAIDEAYRAVRELSQYQS